MHAIHCHLHVFLLFKAILVRDSLRYHYPSFFTRGGISTRGGGAMASSTAAAAAAPAVAGPAVSQQAGASALAVAPPFFMDGLRTIAGSQEFQPWSFNNTCLKYCRYLGKQTLDVAHAFDFDLRCTYRIGVMDHAKSGAWFSFTSPSVQGQMQEWSPAQFLSRFPRAAPCVMRRKWCQAKHKRWHHVCFCCSCCCCWCLCPIPQPSSYPEPPSRRQTRGEAFQFKGVKMFN